MKLASLRDGLASARRATTFLVMLLLAAMATNLILAVLVARMSGHERIVVVPPVVHKTFWLETDRVSPEYLEQMGYFLMQLTLNVTPQSVDHQSKVLLTYAAPAAFGELRTALAATAERLKRDGAATVFSAQDITVDERTLKVGVRGQLTTYISDRRVSEAAKGYAIEFQYSAGRIYLKTFRETNANDPLETQNRPASPAAGV
jgi:conjugal transfer pilus assembly protein TraE